MNKFRAPDDYADAFRILGEIDLLSEDFVKKLIEMARFRNRLVHIYWNVDNELIYTIICEDVDDIEQFIGKIANSLTK